MKLTRYYNSPAVRPLSNFDSLLGFPNSGVSPFFNFAHRLAQAANETSTENSAATFEDDDHFYARFDLPGVKKENLAVDLNGTRLEISAKKPAENESAEAPTFQAIWERAISVPEGVDSQQVSAKLQDGVLTVTLPKAESSKPRSIQVN